jgi:hypothetical protein
MPEPDADWAKDFPPFEEWFAEWFARKWFLDNPDLDGWDRPDDREYQLARDRSRALYEARRIEHDENRRFWTELGRIDAARRRNAPPIPGITYCPRTPADQLEWSESAQRFVGRRCGRNRCPFCGPIVAWWTVKAMELGGPNAAATFWPAEHLEDAVAEAKEIHRSMRALPRDLENVGVKGSFIYAVAHDPPNSRVRMIIRSPNGVTEGLVEEAATKAGLGWGAARALEGDSFWACRDLLTKALSARKVESVEGRQATLDEHLVLNGGRFVTASSAAAWCDQFGSPIGSAAEARKLAKRLSY